MSLTFPQPFADAVSALRGDPRWDAFREQLYALACDTGAHAIEAGDPASIGYARALRDVYTAVEASTRAVKQNAVAKPKPNFLPKPEKSAAPAAGELP